MSPFLITLLWILSLLLTWAYWSVRCSALKTDAEWHARMRTNAWMHEEEWRNKAGALAKLLADARAAGEEDAAELHRRDETILTMRGLNETLRGLNDLLRDRLANAELVCTTNLNKSFRTRLPWPTVISQAFAEDEVSP